MKRSELLAAFNKLIDARRQYDGEPAEDFNKDQEALRQMAIIGADALVNMRRLADAVEHIAGIGKKVFKAPEPVEQQPDTPWAKETIMATKPQDASVHNVDMAKEIADFVSNHPRASREGTSLSQLRHHWGVHCTEKWKLVPTVDWSMDPETQKWSGEWTGGFDG